MVRRHEQSLRSFGYGLVFHRVHKLNYNLSSRSTPPIGHQLQLHNNCITSSNEIISVEVRINRKNWQLSKFAYFSADVILKKKKKRKRLKVLFWNYPDTPSNYSMSLLQQDQWLSRVALRIWPLHSLSLFAEYHCYMLWNILTRLTTPCKSHQLKYKLYSLFTWGIPTIDTRQMTHGFFSMCA